MLEEIKPHTQPHLFFRYTYTVKNSNLLERAIKYITIIESLA